MLIPMYNAEGNKIDMSQEPDNLPQPPISAGMPKLKPVGCATTHENWQTAFKDRVIKRNFRARE